MGWVRSNFSCKSLLNTPQPDLDPRLKRRFAVENSVIRIQKYVIQTLKRQRTHLSKNNASVLNIGQKQCISDFIVDVYLFIIANNPINLIVLNGPRAEELCSTAMKNMVFYDAIYQT